MQINSMSSLLQQYAAANSATSRASPLTGKKMSDADSDGNGSISEVELTSLFEGEAPSDLRTDQISDFAAKMFAKADTNGDGVLSESEFEALKAEMSKPPPPMPENVMEKLGLKHLTDQQAGQLVDVSL